MFLTKRTSIHRYLLYFVIRTVSIFVLMYPAIVSAQQDTTRKDTTLSDTLPKKAITTDTAAVISSAQDMVMTQERLVIAKLGADSIHFQQLFVQGIRFGQKKIIVFRFQTSQAAETEVLKGSRVAFSLSDSTATAELFNDIPERSVFDGISYGGLLTIKCMLPPETEALFDDKKVTRIQIEYLGGVFLLDFNDEQSAVFKSVLAAIR